MPELKVTASSFSLRSRWTNSGGSMTSTPTTDTHTTNFAFALPAGARVTAAKVHATWGSPLGGFALRTCAGKTPDSNGFVAVTIAAGASSLAVEFRMKSNGQSSASDGSHMGVAEISDVYLLIVYEEGLSGLTVTTSAVDAGSTASFALDVHNAAYAHRLTVNFGSRSKTVDIAAGVRTVSVALPMEWLYEIPRAVAGTATATLETLAGGASIGAVQAVFTIMCPAHVLPGVTGTETRLTTVGGVSYFDAGMYVRGKSGVTAELQASGAYGSVIVAAAISCCGRTVQGTTATLTLLGALLTAAGDVPVTYLVTDSRGRTAKLIHTLHVAAYDAPRFTAMAAYRCNDAGAADPMGTAGRYDAAWTMTPLDGKNTVNYTVKWRQKGAEMWTALTSGTGLSASGMLGNALNAQLQYEVCVEISDQYTSGLAWEAVISSAAYYIYRSPDGTSIAFGSATDKQNAAVIAPGKTFWVHGQEILTQIPRRNLLDNSDFTNFVNQRGNGSSNASWAYDGIDRWVNLGSTASTNWHNSDHVALGAVRGIAQPMANKSRFVSKTYTLACKTQEYGVQCVSGVFDGLTGLDSGQDAAFRMYMYSVADDDKAYVRFDNNISTPENYVHIYWAALYEGEYTVETLPPYQPKGYTAELLQCQRYYIKILPWKFVGSGYIAWDGSLVQIHLPTGVQMRTNPTVNAIKGSLITDGTYVYLDNVWASCEANANYAVITIPGSFEQKSQSCSLVMNDTALELSADL